MSVKTLADSNVFPQSAHLPLKRREWSRPLIFGLVLFIVWAWKLHQWFYDRNAVLRPGSYPFPVYNDWDDIPTSKQLHWVRCELPLMVPGNFLCARLAVPMDYQRPLTQSSDSPQVYIALVLLPAAGHGLETGRFSESPLLLNPGGPGGVGTAFVYSNAGPIIQAAVGGNVDLIGFDPRGIGATVPSADCFTEHVTTPSPGADNVAMMRRLTWLLMAHDVGLPNGTNDAMDILAHRARAASKLCSQKDSEESGLRYMATPNVAADMKSIVDAHDDWLEENGFETAALGVEKRSSNEAAPPSTKRKLVFWGFSYGSLLGQTFASMYPDAVGRLILDGVVASNVYNTPSEWVSNMRDADSIVERFFYYCQLAEEKCALFRQGDEAKDIKARYDRVISGLRAEPLIVVSRYINMPVVIMEADIQKSFFTALYSPMRTFSIIAHILNIIYEAGDLSSLLIYPDLTPMCNADFKIPISLDESFAAVGCSDRRPKRNETLNELYKRTSEYTSFAGLWMSLMMACEGWDIEASFPSPDWDANLQSPDPVNTSFPILFASTTFDPVTPLVNAVEMSQNFVNAGVFEVQAEGHTTLAAVSLCALGKIRNYLHKGIVPPQPVADADGILSGWDKCKSDEQPWKPFQADAAMRAEGLHVLQALGDVHAEIINRLTPLTKFRL